jgi:DNA replication protein DnaC
MFAALLAKEVVSTGVRAYMDTLQGIVDAYTAGWTSKADRDGFLKHITDVAVLGVDDIGREYQGGRGVNTRALEQVLRHRAQHGLVTIVTTNYTPEEVSTGYGGHIVSVLSESSDVLEFGGVDLRPKILERQKRERDLGLTRPLVIR